MKNRPEKFKQPTPCDQLIALHASLLGHISNCTDGIITPRELEYKSDSIFDDIYELQKWFKSVKWEDF